MPVSHVPLSHLRLYCAEVRVAMQLSCTGNEAKCTNLHCYVDELKGNASSDN